MNKNGVIALIIGASIATFTALAHLSCIFLGPSCYKAQLAPAHIVKSAIEGTWNAPIETIIVSSLFLACALFALSAAGFIRKLPLLKSALITISTICILRGLATIPLANLEPALQTPFALIAGFIWFLAGCLYLYGFICFRRAQTV